MKLLLVIILTVLIGAELSAQIYICVDTNGRKHYSDKRCPAVNQNVAGTINKSGKREIPPEIKAFSAAIELLKRSFALLTIHEPANREYAELYQMVTRSQIRHRRFLSNPDANRFTKYAPFNRANQQRIISSISNACRNKAYFSICSMIEGNPWISAEEKDYASENSNLSQLASGAQLSNCDKAAEAHTGGVISDKMLLYFCRTDNRG